MVSIDMMKPHLPPKNTPAATIIGKYARVAGAETPPAVNAKHVHMTHNDAIKKADALQ